jgi:hypothetical protein
MANLNEQARITQVTVDKVFLYQKAHLMEDYPGLRDNSQISAVLDACTRQVILTMTSWCAAGRIPDAEVWETVEWPDGVWQMFKSKFMPHWFLRHFPVRNARKNVKTQTNHYFVCPHIHTGDNRQHIQFMVTGTGTAERISRGPNG